MLEDFDELIQTANHFRKWVCEELCALCTEERKPLRGDYVFVIDGAVRFIVFVEDTWCGSLVVKKNGEFLVDETVPVRLSATEFEILVTSAYRVKVSTDSSTLKKLLHGTIKARLAYLNGLVNIEGDLPVFLGLVGKLKARGVRPVVSANGTTVASPVTFS